jgi:hypothetical protein
MHERGCNLLPCGPPNLRGSLRRENGATTTCSGRRTHAGQKALPSGQLVAGIAGGGVKARCLRFRVHYWGLALAGIGTLLDSKVAGNGGATDQQYIWRGWRAESSKRNSRAHEANLDWQKAHSRDNRKAEDRKKEAGNLSSDAGKNEPITKGSKDYLGQSDCRGDAEIISRGRSAYSRSTGGGQTCEGSSLRVSCSQNHAFKDQIGHVFREVIQLTGIGSEGVGALTLKRRFIGSELKQSYFEQACMNLESANLQTDLFS